MPGKFLCVISCKPPMSVSLTSLALIFLLILVHGNLLFLNWPVIHFLNYSLPSIPMFLMGGREVFTGISLIYLYLSLHLHFCCCCLVECNLGSCTLAWNNIWLTFNNFTFIFCLFLHYLLCDVLGFVFVLFFPNSFIEI